MKQYYYAENDHQLGPFTVEELISKRIKKSTLVWTDGMDDWATAVTIDELKDIIISEPPPLIKKLDKPIYETVRIQKPKGVVIKKNDKYDYTYENDDNVTKIGILFLIIPLIFVLLGAPKIESEENYNILKALIAISLLIVRIGVTIWVYKIALKQNRNEIIWGCFAFLLPSIALIIIGLLKKKRLKIIIDGTLNIDQQISLLLEKTHKYYAIKSYSECIDLISKVIELDSLNYYSFRLRGIFYYENNELENAQIDFKFLETHDEFMSDVNYYLGNIELKNNNREKAIKYWLKARDLGNKEVINSLDLYYNYYKKYFLTKDEAYFKIGIPNFGVSTYNGKVKYIRGIIQIDKFEQINKLDSDIYIYDNGIIIMTHTTSKTLYIAISYFEIDKYEIIENGDLLEIYLLDDIILHLSYNNLKDYLWYKKFCEIFNMNSIK